MTVLDTALPRSPDSVHQARDVVHDHVTGLTVQQRADAVLMVSELVTNAFVHGVGTIVLRIDADADATRIEVSDQGEVSLASSLAPGAHGGWGLRIVDRLADDWGVLAGSTRVWFRLVRRSEHR